ncbi:MAG TPA: LysE family transporter [Spirochaetia bacterium]|nr:LysE family transporter [Spirochaetia bacterium]
MGTIVAFLSYVLVTTFTPGPNNLIAMSNANVYGFRKALSLIFGIFIGFVVIMLLSSFLNLFLFNLIPKIKLFMELIGAVYMVYLAVKIVKSKPDSNENEAKHNNSFILGFALQFLNAKAIIYGITVTSNFIIPYYKSTASLIFFSVFLAFVAFLATSCWALFGAFFYKFLSQYRVQFNIVMVVLLLYSAISLFA